MSDYTTHPEYLALLQAVLHNPADDLPRLVMADWLEENGETERANFIRWQCESFRNRACAADGVDNFTRTNSFLYMWRKGCRCRPCTIRRRTDEILYSEHFCRWERQYNVKPTERFINAGGMSGRGRFPLFAHATRIRSGRGFLCKWHIDEQFIQFGGLGDLLSVEPVEHIGVDGLPGFSSLLRVEITPPDGQGSGWQAYYSRPHDTTDDYFHMDSWECREEMVEQLPQIILETVRVMPGNRI